jgi:hypothetical protein
MFYFKFIKRGCIKMGKYDNCVKCTKSSCELCSAINADAIDMEGHGAKLLTVRIKLNNVCLGKRVAVACIIYDKCHRILAFKGFITMACGDKQCGENSCGTIQRKILFVIPDNDEFDPENLDASTVCNYIYPCDSNK